MNREIKETKGWVTSVVHDPKIDKLMEDGREQ